MKFKLFWITTCGDEWLEESFECENLESARVIAADYYSRTNEKAKSLVERWRSDGEDVDLYLGAETTPWALEMKIVAGIGES